MNQLLHIRYLVHTASRLRSLLKPSFLIAVRTVGALALLLHMLVCAAVYIAAEERDDNDTSAAASLLNGSGGIGYLEGWGAIEIARLGATSDAPLAYLLAFDQARARPALHSDRKTPSFFRSSDLPLSHAPRISTPTTHPPCITSRNSTGALDTGGRRHRRDHARAARMVGHLPLPRPRGWRRRLRLVRRFGSLSLDYQANMRLGLSAAHAFARPSPEHRACGLVVDAMRHDSDHLRQMDHVISYLRQFRVPAEVRHKVRRASFAMRARRAHACGHIARERPFGVHCNHIGSRPYTPPCAHCTIQVCNFYEYTWSNRHADSSAEHQFAALPAALRIQLELSVKRKLVEAVTLFENMSTPCLVAIIQRLVQVMHGRTSCVYGL